MSLTLEKTFPRLWTLTGGVVMVVTDLHGDWEAYCRYRDRFEQLYQRNQVDGLIFTGDLIHAESADQDRSLEIILDLLTLRETYGSAVIYLCGNHELPHIYSISLAKGDRVYTPEFERALNVSQRRAEIIELFKALPFYLRTQAGVALTHAGASAATVQPAGAGQLFAWDHERLLNWANEVLAVENIEALRKGYAKMQQGLPYETLARHYLAVSGPDDPRYNDLVRGFVASSHPTFDQILWPALFTRCEREYGAGDYAIFLEALLQELSQDFTPQEWLVAGHMTIHGGYRLVAKRHLRLASAHHATPRQAGQYLLLDTAQPVRSHKALVKGLGSVYN